MSASASLATPLEDEVAAFFQHDPRLVANPYPLYRRLREERPAFRQGEQVLITRYHDAREILTAPTTLQGLAAKGSRYRDAERQLALQHRIELGEMFGFLEKRLGGTNGDHHTRLRKLAQKAFTPKMVARMEERIQAITDNLLSRVSGADVVELIDDFAYHLPLIVISEMLDIPTEDRDRIRKWANDLGQFVGANWSNEQTVSLTHESVFRLREYLYSVFELRRNASTTDLLGALLAAEGDEGEKFTEDELVAMVTQFVFAGHETTTNLIGNSTVLLLRDHHAVWEQLCAEPERIPAAVEELLRFESPTQYVDKLASEDGEIAGTPIRQWDTLSVVLGSANRDPEAFDDPETFDITRERPAHLTFGFGAHHCLGASLARMEATIALRTLTRRFPDMRLVSNEVEWRSNHMLRGPERLPVILGADRG